MKEAVRKLREKFPEYILNDHSFKGDETVVIERHHIFEVLKFLRDTNGLEFSVLIDLCGVDWPESDERLEVVYHLYSIKNKKRLRVKVRLPESDPKIQSVTGLWRAANWFEREAYDMFGIRFEGHPNLKRLLMYEGFEGHPLRKDYPIDRRQKIPVPDKLI